MTWGCNVRAAVEHEFRAAQRLRSGVVDRVGDERVVAPSPRPPDRSPRTARIVQLRLTKKPEQASDITPGGTP